jgi:hypothetical protein
MDGEQEQEGLGQSTPDRIRCTATTLATRLVGGEGLAKEGAEGHNKETSGPVSVLCGWCYAGSGLVLGVGSGGGGGGSGE